MQAYIGEFIGTMILIILGDGVVAGVLLRNSKAENSGWIVITFGWAMAVAVAVWLAASVTSPKMACLLSSHGVGASVMKNWLPLVFGPALAIARAPRTTLCGLISSLNL